MKKILSFVLLIVIASSLTACQSTSNRFSEYHGQTADVIFNNSETALVKGHYSDAVKGFEALDAIYPFGPYAEQGQLDIIYAYYKDGEDASALAAADRYIRLYPRGKHVDYAYYMKGLIHFEQGGTWVQKLAHSDPAPRDLADKQQAFTAFAHIMHYYPHSSYAVDSAFRMAYIRNMVARKQILVAEYYFKRKAYVAAANRASYVVKHFNGTPEVQNALVIMVKAYRKLNLQQLADDSLRILQVSYPDSEQLKELT